VNAIALVVLALWQSPAPAKPPTADALIAAAVPQLVKMQEEGGQWPYEGVYRVDGEIPVGYRVGGTSIVGGALLAAAPGDPAAAAAIDRALDFVLSPAGLAHELMAPSKVEAYDVRVWGHAYALEFLCRLRAAKRCGKRAADVDAWIPKLVDALATERLHGGGWNYDSTRHVPASFVTAPVAQALLVARGAGVPVPDGLLGSARSALQEARFDGGTFAYSGGILSDAKTGARPDGRAQLPGSIARSPICETTLRLLGAGSVDAIRDSIAAFHEHWGELEKRRRKNGTHDGPYGIAPYYCYYGHRYAAQAIQMLPTEEREPERARLLEVILRTRDEDGTWNDRVFPRSRNFGTAMIVLALLGDRAPLPPSL
jgi:hypothetical protein